jgi:hypothetical protein
MEFLMGRTLLNALYNLDVKVGVPAWVCARVYVGACGAGQGSDVRRRGAARGGTGPQNTQGPPRQRQRRAAVPRTSPRAGEDLPHEGARLDPGPNAIAPPQSLTAAGPVRGGAQRAGVQAREPGPEGKGRRAGQRRPGPPGRVLPGQHGDDQPAGVGVRHPLPVRHVPAGACARARKCGRGGGGRGSSRLSPGGWGPLALGSVGDLGCLKTAARPAWALPARSPRHSPAPTAAPVPPLNPTRTRDIPPLTHPPLPGAGAG